MNRREFLIASAALCATTFLARGQTTQPKRDQRYKISAADWMMLKRQTPGALDRAKECGLDGVEVDMGPLGKRPDFENKLTEDSFRNDYLKKAHDNGLEISSLAMSAFYGQAFGKHEKATQFASTWIDLMPKVGTKVGFLPIIGIDNDDVRAKTVEDLKSAAPLAEKARVILGINTSLDSAGNKNLLDDIGSPAIRIAYNCGEAIDANRDVYRELKDLGRDRIAEIIPTLSDGVLLKDDTRLDVPRLKSLLDEMNWSGWLVLQRSRDKNRARDVKYNFSANAAYLKSIFQA
jgi:sugar phosphate isomerase/epimerase